MKLAILTDPHFGVRNNNLNLLKDQELFLSTIFFPYIQENNIDTVLIGGDIFDNRKNININILEKTKEMFVDKLPKTYMILGNHDIYHKNTSKVNSLKSIFEKYDNITIIDEPTEIQFGSSVFHFIPWINDENVTKTFEFIQKKATGNEFLLAHLELMGFEVMKNNFMEHGMDRAIFSKSYKRVFSGHYHHKSEQGNILYLGTATQTTFADSGNVKGFHVFDTETQELEFVENPNTLFEIIKIDNLTNDIVKAFDYQSYREKYVRVELFDYESKDLLKVFNDNFNNIGVYSLIIQDRKENVSDKKNKAYESVNIHNLDEVLKAYINTLDVGLLDVDELYHTFKAYHTTAENQ
jgi:DNA repair exonuclease SbcCD nuclease subunit